MNGIVLLELKYVHHRGHRGYFDRVASMSLAPAALDIPQQGPGGIGAP
jgi:hypothetical protein